MTLKRRCSGISAKTHPYDQRDKNLFGAIVRGVRAEFTSDFSAERIKTKDLLLGPRFGDDDIVLLTLSSAASAEQFRQEPLTWVYDALMDCAERDYWYTVEKDWGQRPFNPDEEEQEHEQAEGDRAGYIDGCI